MWRPKSVFEALLPLHVLSCIFSLGILQYPLNHFRIGLSIFYTILTMFIYLLSLNYISQTLLSSYFTTQGDIIMISTFYFHTCIYLSNVILVWIFRKRVNKASLRARKVDEQFERLKVPLDYHAIYILSLKYMAIWFILSLGINLIDELWDGGKSVGLSSIAVFLLFHLPMCGNTVVTIIICVYVEIMRYRFEKVNRALSDIIKKRQNYWRMETDHRRLPIPLTVTTYNSRFHNNISTSRIATIEIIRITRHIHLELSSLCNEISYIYGCQLVTACLSAFIIVTGTTYIIYMTVMSASLDGSLKLLQVTILIFWLTLSFLLIVNVNYVCANTNTEWKRSGRIIHELEMAYSDRECSYEIRQFSLQILQNPLSLTACGFFELGYGFLIGFMGSVTTYVIIFVQMTNA